MYMNVKLRGKIIPDFGDNISYKKMSKNYKKKSQNNLIGAHR